MPNFTTKEKLKVFLQAQSVDALFARVPAGEESSPLAYADSIITAYTLIEPSATNHPLLVSIASRIVIWEMTGTHQGLEEAEIKRRKDQYMDALEQLRQISEGDIKLSSSTSSSATGSTDPRVEDW